MVSVEVSKAFLLGASGCSESQLIEALPQIKCEVDSDENGVLRIEVTGDRPDLLSREGIARALRGWLNKETGLPEMKLSKSNYRMLVDASVSKIRPFIVCAFARGVSFKGDDIAELMQVQEKLTLTHGRRRRKVAIGIHDANKIKPPFVYKAVAANEIAFVPLGKIQEMTPLKILEEHEKGREYAFALGKTGKYPIIFDSTGEVVSFPPIINAARTTVTESTRDLFLDVTGTDFESCNVALNILCQNYSDAGARIQSMEVHYPRKHNVVTPHTQPHVMTADIAWINKNLGIDADSKFIIQALERQRFNAQKQGAKIRCEIPRYRADFLHPIDLVEEVAIGIGYNNFEPKAPGTYTRGCRSEESLLQDKVRDLVMGAGYLELTTPVVSNEAIAAKSFSEKTLVKIRNPVSSDYSHLRSTLLPGLIEAVSRNTHNTYPQKIFEVGEVVACDEKKCERTRTDVHVACLTAHSESNLTESASVLKELMNSLKMDFSLRKKNFKQFINGRSGFIDVAGNSIGVIGEVHPEVLENWGIHVPCSAFEIRLLEF
ncbi:MAG: phenylalanine--tRNA ligase subunit beta [Candidatus Micrarchaeota archaeon]